MEKRNVIESERTPGFQEKQADSDPVTEAAAHFALIPGKEDADGKHAERA